jgi:hypothetical protein
MLSKVVSGGQTGADQGALHAPRAADIATGGWAPREWLVGVPALAGAFFPNRLNQDSSGGHLSSITSLLSLPANGNGTS